MIVTIFSGTPRPTATEDRLSASNEEGIDAAQREKLLIFHRLR
jgi:hypothetical protein